METQFGNIVMERGGVKHCVIIETHAMEEKNIRFSHSCKPPEAIDRWGPRLKVDRVDDGGGIADGTEDIPMALQ